MTTVDLSLDKLIPGQLRYVNQYFEVVGVAADTGLLKGVGEREGVRVIEVPMHREISLMNDVKSLWQLVRLFRMESPDILHCNTPKGSLLGLMAGKIAGVPHRIYTVTGLRYQGATGLFRWILMTMERISCACATKVIPEGQGVLHTLQADRITHKPLQVLHYGNINGIDTKYYSYEALALTEDNNDRTMNSTNGTNLSDDEGIREIRVIRSDSASLTTDENNDRTMNSTNDTNLLDDEKIREIRVIRSLRRKLGGAVDDFVFVFVGRIVKDKGINELAQSMRQLDCKLLLVGSFDDDDPISEEDRRFLETSPKVKCVGWQEDVRPFIAAADALVFPSYREGFPNVPIQAGALGKPCIVTDINGCNEIIKDGLNGKIIQVKDQAALQNTMQWFLSHPEEVRRMAGNARGMITSRYEQQDVWQKTLQMYQKLSL